MNIVSQIKRIYGWIKVKIKKVLIVLGFIGIATAATLTASDLNTNDVSIESLATKYQMATEIKAEYSLSNASLIKTEVKNQELDKYTGEFKDEVRVEIGEIKTISTPILGGLLGVENEQVIEPSISLSRWGETNLKIKPNLSDVENKDKKIILNENKIRFETPKIDYDFYSFSEGEGGYKMVWFLKEKPESNIISFQIESQNLDFFYQPPLTQEYQNGYSEEWQKEIVVSETQVKDLEGNVLVERPENTVGSYAVYHSTKGGMNDANGKDYKAGKAFHIYRPHLFDANGLEAWGNLHIENGIYSVEIPQDFLDKVQFPLKSNDEFGYHTNGLSSADFTASSILTNGSTYTGISGVVNSISLYCKYVTSRTARFTMHIYDTSSPSNKIDVSQEITPISTMSWLTGNSTLSPTLSVGTTYYLTEMQKNSYSYVGYDTQVPYNKYKSSITYGTWPSTITWNGNYTTIIISIYATYTPGGGGGAVAPSPQVIIIE